MHPKSLSYAGRTHVQFEFASLCSGTPDFSCHAAGRCSGTHRDGFHQGLYGDSNLAPAVCECSAGKARGELSPDGFALLVAMLEGNETLAAQLRSKLPIDQVMKAGTFMARGPAQCAKASSATD